MDAGDAEGQCAGGAALPAAGPGAGRMGYRTGRALGTLGALGTTLSRPFVAASCQDFYMNGHMTTTLKIK